MNRNESISGRSQYINLKVSIYIYNCLHIKGFIILPVSKNGPSTLGSASDLL